MSEKETDHASFQPRPARTTEGRENQLVSAAMRLAESQIKDGTASAQVLTHFLKLGSERTKLENAKLEAETKYAIAKVESVEQAKRLEEKYDKALEAMRSYSGFGEEVYEEYEEEF